MTSTRVTVTRMAILAGFVAALGGAPGCDGGAGGTVQPLPEDLTQRAYVVSQESDELTAIDLRTLDVIGRVATLGVGNHMAELNADYSKAYVSSPRPTRSSWTTSRGCR